MFLPTASSLPMKGPGERTKYDFRRVWECPVCHHRERTGGDVTCSLCACQRKLDPHQRVWMRLVLEGGRRIDAPKPESMPVATEASAGAGDDPSPAYFEDPSPDNPEDPSPGENAPVAPD